MFNPLWCSYYLPTVFASVSNISKFGGEFMYDVHKDSVIAVQSLKLISNP